MFTLLGVAGVVTVITKVGLPSGITLRAHFDILSVLDQSINNGFRYAVFHVTSGLFSFCRFDSEHGDEKSVEILVSVDYLYCRLESRFGYGDQIIGV